MPGCLSPIESHPAKQQVIDGIMSGTPYVELAKLVGVSPMSISRYAKRVVKPAIRYVKTIASESINAPISEVNKTVRSVASVQQPVAAVVSRLQKRNERRDALLSDAAAAKDFRGYASLDTCEHRDIELECRLTGLLSDNQAISNTTINLVCDSISINAQPAAQPADDCIDIASVRIDE